MQKQMWKNNRFFFFFWFNFVSLSGLFHPIVHSMPHSMLYAMHRNCSHTGGLLYSIYESRKKMGANGISLCSLRQQQQPKTDAFVSEWNKFQGKWRSIYVHTKNAEKLRNFPAFQHYLRLNSSIWMLIVSKPSVLPVIFGRTHIQQRSFASYVINHLSSIRD